ARFIVDGTLDSNGNYWVFGGAASENPTTWYNDLWVYDSENNEWTWRGGSQSVNQLPVYGTQGVPDISNIPGARENHLIWSDELGNLWLFGGYGLDINGAVGHLNDLWKYSITDAQWTWLGGNDEANQGGTHGVLGEATSGSYPGARASALQWINSNGIVWIFGGQGYDKFGVSAEYLNDLWSYDPSTNQWIWHSGSDFANSTGSYNETGLSSTAYVPGSRWHGSNWIDNEDNLYLFGGYLFNQTTTGRYNDFWKYEPTTKEWTWISGVNATTEIDDIGTYGDIQIGSKPFPGARHGGLTWTDPAGDFWMLGGAFFGSSRGMLTDLWKYEPEKDEWNYIRGSTEMILNNGVYGARGIGNPSNEPRSRWHGSSWLGDDGRLWFFGGLNINQSTNNTAWLNDLWVYDPASDIYTWMGGSSDINGDAVYGINGQASAA
ncbi:MAG: kelch repeat-containing protein, partial [Pseudomonadales bacterium]